MFNSEKEFLSLFGWNHFFASQILDLDLGSLFPARVISEERNLYRVQAGLNEIFWASVTGKMQFNALSRADYPAVGDWVLVEKHPQSDRGVIQQVLSRKTLLYRKQVGSNADLQILSTNVDYAFITTSVNADLNFRRIERYLIVVRESGATPIILLTKSDLRAHDIDLVTDEVRNQFPGVEVQALSKDSFESNQFLSSYLQPGTTSIFIGSSGVGKSTLVNFLINDEKIKTQEVRSDDDKGKHTTTSRHLYVSRYGGLIIDTPGMRELQLSDHEEGLNSQFSDVEELIQNCRFKDCQHETEPGCAVIEALQTESLDESRWQSYLKLQAEIRHQMRKQDKVLAAEDRKLWKKRNVEAKQWSRMKRGR